MKTTTQREYEERILRALVHIQGHLDEALDLDRLAGIAHFSPYHFHRVFRGMVGEPLMAHVRRLRLERAANHLKTTDRPVTRIAFDAGYETHEAFTRAFSGWFGQPPSQFRESRDAFRKPAAPSGIHYAPVGAVEPFQIGERPMTTLDVRIEEFPSKRVAFMRHVGPYDQVGATWQKLMGWAYSHGQFGGMASPLAVVHDDPDITPPDKLRYDACIAVDERFEPEGEIGAQDIAGGPYAVATHHGPYERLGETYAALMGQWLPAHD